MKGERLNEKKEKTKGKNCRIEKGGKKKVLRKKQKLKRGILIEND